MSAAARSWTLPAAAVLAAVEAVVLMVALATGGHPGAGLLIAFVAVKLPFCWFAAQRRPGAYLALIVWELAGALAALAAHDVAIGLRALEIVAALVVIVLLLASMSQFPTVGLPESSS